MAFSLQINRDNLTGICPLSEIFEAVNLIIKLFLSFFLSPPSQQKIIKNQKILQMTFVRHFDDIPIYYDCEKFRRIHEKYVY